ERRRNFETGPGVVLTPPRPCHHDESFYAAGSYGGAARVGATPAERRHYARHVRHGGYVPDAPVQAALLGVDWMTVGGMNQCIPPAYAEHVGAALLAAIDALELAA